MSASNAENIVFFDGYCHLCSGVVSFLIKRDKNEHLRYAPLDSEFARSFIGHTCMASQANTVLFYAGGILYEKSTAVLKILKYLSGIWPIFSFLLIIPRPVRDALYNFVSKHRYKWFGHREKCYLPQKDVRHLFLQ